MLDKKTVLITGATKNNGFGMAKIFASYGADVYVNGAVPSEVENAVQALRSQSEGNFHFACADVSDESEVVTMVENIIMIILLSLRLCKQLLLNLQLT